MPALRSRTRAVFIAILGAVAVYGIVGAFVAPPLAKRMLASQLGERLGRTVQVDDVAIAPYTLDASIRGLRILEPDGKTVFAAFDALDVKGSIASVYHWAPVVDAVTLTGLKVHLVRDGGTHYNVSDILARMKPAPKAGVDGAREAPPARFSVANLRVVDAAVDFDDRPNAVTQRLSEMRIAIPLISNLPRHVKHPVQPAFSAKINGAPLALTGEALPFDSTVRTHFELDIRALDLPRYLAYLPSPLPVRVDSGKLDARIAVRFAQAPGQESTVQLTGTAGLADVALSNGDGPLGRFARLEVDIASLDPVAGVAKVASVRLSDASALRDDWRVRSAEARDVGVDLRKHVLRVASLSTEGGTLTLKRAADGTFEAPRTPGGTGEPVAWNVAVKKAALSGYEITVHDATVKPAARHHLVLASLEADDVSNAAGWKGSAKAKMRLDRGGALDASSTFATGPLRVSLTLDARSVDLVPLRAYVSQFPAVALKGGSASAKGTLKLAQERGAIRVAYAGSARIDDLATLDTLAGEELLDWKSVASNGIELGYAPGAPFELTVRDVTVDRAYSRIVVTRDGKLNVQQLRTATPEAPQAATPAAPVPARNVRIGRITFVDSRLNFTDHYIRPNYTADVGRLNGSVSHLSSQPSSRATVALAGRWNATSPVVIAGTINPLAGDLFLDIAAKGEDIDLTKLTAYSQRYAGYGITDGRLTLDVKYHVENGKLEGRNTILVDRLAFGEKVESPEATKLPVLFAINLLKDRNGRINLTLPISGSLEDPKFELGAVIAQIFSGPLQKAETSPFSLITAGAGGGDDLAFVEFEPGLAALTPATEKKLDALVKVLEDRPGIRLEVAPSLDAARDREALESAARERRLAAAPKDLPKEAREKLAAEPVEIGEEALKELSAKRAELVKAYLVASGRLPAERVLVASGASRPAEGDKPRLSRVDFALR